MDRQSLLRIAQFDDSVRFVVGAYARSASVTLSATRPLAMPVGICLLRPFEKRVALRLELVG